MRAFTCEICGNLLAFENSVCLRCGTQTGYAPERRTLVPLNTGQVRCANAQRAACNWLVPACGPPLCESCALTRVRPADDDTAARLPFQLAEAAKRRLVFQLDELGLPRDADRLGFELLSSEREKVVTGHADGVVTLDLAEGDDAHRAELQRAMDEPYRTLLGHFRHETGHYYWTVLVDRTPALQAFRGMFGDERADYGAALAAHYDTGPPAGWEQSFVSAYATAHPWEDWAESFAHYLHMRDTLQTAAAFGVVVAGPDLPGQVLSAIPLDEPDDWNDLASTWHAFTLAMNAVNRSMGAGDLYPFVLAPAAATKLRFVHRLVTT